MHEVFESVLRYLHSPNLPFKRSPKLARLNITMADCRTISQEYAKEGIKAALLVNGAAAASLLTQAAKLIEQGLADQAGRAMIAWAAGVFFASATWLVAFMSTRYVDKSERENSHSHLIVSNKLMYAGFVTVTLSLLCFIIGCGLLAAGFLHVGAVKAIP
ncbi:MAG: hypothetical protein EOS76_01280 [Mesorhizobium sp.]|uniref:hypothetical protein n=1 Tax=Mesorhizobium sp. TaxID=1871066 RepID=UPI000FE62254|nr:hypothetical protein [Mesorhizobium sp.]RWE22464.1 MAG: hypothetical protein EOS76_01280 [Mesorhizobium sp.]